MNINLVYVWVLCSCLLVDDAISMFRIFGTWWWTDLSGIADGYHCPGLCSWSRRVPTLFTLFQFDDLLKNPFFRQFFYEAYYTKITLFVWSWLGGWRLVLVFLSSASPTFLKWGSLYGSFRNYQDASKKLGSYLWVTKYIAIRTRMHG